MFYKKRPEIAIPKKGGIINPD